MLGRRRALAGLALLDLHGTHRALSRLRSGAYPPTAGTDTHCHVLLIGSARPLLRSPAATARTERCCRPSPGDWPRYALPRCRSCVCPGNTLFMQEYGDGTSSSSRLLVVMAVVFAGVLGCTAASSPHRSSRTSGWISDRFYLWHFPALCRAGSTRPGGRSTTLQWLAKVVLPGGRGGCVVSLRGAASAALPGAPLHRRPAPASIPSPSWQPGNSR